MTLTKKGRRNITVDNVRYIWQTYSDGDGNFSIALSKPAGGQILIANIHIISAEGVVIITNYIVRQIILQGLIAGWTPTEQKATMYLRRFQEHIDISKATFIGSIKNSNHD